MNIKKLGNELKEGIKNKVGKTVVAPLNDLLDQNINDVATTIGSFIVRSVRGKFQRSITFTIGYNYADKWMEEALYGILYKYNTIKKSSRLELSNKPGMNDGTGMYYMLDDGTHNLKYRDYDILLAIQTNSPQSMSGRVMQQRIYTIITYDLSPEFVTQFEKDMIAHRNSLLKIKSDSPTVAVYQDLHESDGYTYWEKTLNINKRRIGTIYLPLESKEKIVNTVNEFFGSKDYYKRHGIAHNLKILLYGPPGPQPVSTMIPTPNGMKRMGDLKVGDKVFDKNGAPTTVTEIHPKGVQDVYEVEFLDGRKARCTIDHLWTVYRRSHGKWHEEVLPLEHILRDSNLTKCDDGSTSISGEKRYSIPANGKAQFNERPITIDPYVMGVFITNGCLTDKYLRVSQPTPEVPNIIAEICNFQVEKRSSDVNDYSYIFYDQNHNRIRTDEFFKDYSELIGTKSPFRKIPEDYLFNSISNRMKLLQGLMDGDGSIIFRKDREWMSPIIRYNSTSKELIEQVMWLLRSLSFRCNIVPDNRDRYTSGYCADISITGHPNEIPSLFKVSYKVANAIESMEKFKNLKDDKLLKWNTDYERTKFVSVKKLDNPEEVMCIKVDNDEHLYLTEDFVVTHNTGKDSIAKMIASEWNRNIYYITGGKDGKFISNAIVSSDNEVNYPLFLISDIDKYPYLINEPDMDISEGEGSKEEKIRHKQMFGSMINALDGVLSGEGRIIIMTTNHIEKFSETFLRPGRIDLALEVGYVTPEVFRKYTYDFYNVELPEDIKLREKNITIAKLQFDVVFLKLTADEFIKKYVK